MTTASASITRSCVGRPDDHLPARPGPAQGADRAARSRPSRPPPRSAVGQGAGESPDTAAHPGEDRASHAVRRMVRRHGPRGRRASSDRSPPAGLEQRGSGGAHGDVDGTVGVDAHEQRPTRAGRRPAGRAVDRRTRRGRCPRPARCRGSTWSSGTRASACALRTPLRASPVRSVGHAHDQPGGHGDEVAVDQQPRRCVRRVHEVVAEPSLADEVHRFGPAGEHRLGALVDGDARRARDTRSLPPTCGEASRTVTPTSCRGRRQAPGGGEAGDAAADHDDVRSRGDPLRSMSTTRHRAIPGSSTADPRPGRRNRRAVAPSQRCHQERGASAAYPGRRGGAMRVPVPLAVRRSRASWRWRARPPPQCWASRCSRRRAPARLPSGRRRGAAPGAGAASGAPRSGSRRPARRRRHDRSRRHADSPAPQAVADRPSIVVKADVGVRVRRRPKATSALRHARRAVMTPRSPASPARPGTSGHERPDQPRRHARPAPAPGPDDVRPSDH